MAPKHSRCAGIQYRVDFLHGFDPQHMNSNDTLQYGGYWLSHAATGNKGDLIRGHSNFVVWLVSHRMDLHRTLLVMDDSHGTCRVAW